MIGEIASEAFSVCLEAKDYLVKYREPTLHFFAFVHAALRFDPYDIGEQTLRRKETLK